MMEKVYSEMAKTRLIGIREYVNSIRVNEALQAVHIACCVTLRNLNG